MTNTERSEITCLWKPDTMGTVMVEHYADFPISDLPKAAVHSLSKRWLGRDDVFYIEARRENGEFLGFIFGQKIGEQPWRTLMTSPWWVMLCAIWIRLKQRLHFRREAIQLGGKTESPRYSRVPARMRTSSTAKIEYMMVMPEARGKRIASYLLAEFESRVRKTELAMISAHIAAHNQASIRAVERAGFLVFSESNTSLRAIKPLSPSANR